MTMKKKDIKTWGDMTAAERKRFLANWEEGEYNISHSNPYIERKLMDMIPLGVAEFGGALAVYSQLNGVVPRVITEELKLRWQANTLPVIFPNDTLITKL